jgi:two-component system chemotaxis response regulator CheY
MRVLIVDDSSTMRRIIANTLKRLGYDDIAEAGDGTEGLRSLASRRADMVLTDWNMPEMDGRDFVRAIRAQPAIADVPVLMITTHATREDVVLALQAGVNDYLVKPFTPESLREKIEGLTRR